jgi:hypothetical protein
LVDTGKATGSGYVSQLKFIPFDAHQPITIEGIAYNVSCIVAWSQFSFAHNHVLLCSKRLGISSFDS